MSKEAIRERLDDLLTMIDQPCTPDCSDGDPCRTCQTVAMVRDLQAEIVAA